MKTKKTKDLKKGDRIRVEYGIQGNWINVEMLEDAERTDTGAWKLRVKYIDFEHEVTMYSISADEETEIIE